MKEIWKDINGYDGVFQVSNLGRFKSNGFEYSIRKRNGEIDTRYAQPKILSQSYTVEGYLVVSLTKDGKTKQYKAHRLIAQAFIDNPKNLPQINHINGIKDDNRIENLEWCTSKENTIHAHSTGLCGRNAKSKYVARLNEDMKIEKVYESARKASIDMGHLSSCSNLHKVCRQGKGRWCGYMWKYINYSEYVSSIEKDY